MKISIIEDNDSIRSQLQKQFEQEGFIVNSAADGEEGLYFVRDSPCDCAIVDLGLPEMSGIELIQAARKDGCKTPIIVLTARDAWQDKVKALEVGADDYVVKPFEFAEVLARVRALLRRTGQWTDTILKCPPIELNSNTQEVFLKGDLVKLTTQEFRLLSYLMTYAGKIISKDKLTLHIYDDEVMHESNVIEVFIRRLRKKLDPDSSLKPIETVRGSGYRWILPRQS